MVENKKKIRKAEVDGNHCVSCGACCKVCPVGALSIYKGIRAVVNKDKCVACSKCVKECPASVIELVEVSL